MLKKLPSVLFISSLLTCSAINASDEFDDLLNIMEETTQIATKNKVNADYAPGIISILKCDDLKRMGARDLYEALKFIPNIDININDIGTSSIVVRGIGGALGSGKTKILINGVSQNTANTAIFNANLPIEVIDRIEVLRGPASALYGEYAFNGVINIITKSDENSLFIRYTKLKDNGVLTTGATFFQNGKNFTINGIISSEKTDGLETYTTDGKGNSGNTETSLADKVFISNIKYKNFLANIAIYEQKKGAFYGPSKVLPSNDDKYNHIHKNQNILLSNKFTLSDNVEIIPKVGYYKYSAEHILDSLDNVKTPYTYKHPFNEYDKQTIGAELFYTTSTQDILLGAEYSKIQEIDNILKTTEYTIIPPSWGPPLIDTTSTKSTDKEHKREVSSLYLQDNIKINDNFITNIGVRYDKYSDKLNNSLDKSFLPRVAFVYIVDKRNIIKTQYGKAYRPVTFLETQPMETAYDIKPEVVDTIEMQHSYKINNLKFSTTAFYSKLQDMLKINRSASGFWYENSQEDIISRGVEFEYTNKLSTDYLIMSNLTYTDAYNDKTKKQLANYSKILSNIALSYKPYSIFSSTIYLRYVDKKKRDVADTRDDLDSSLICDINFRYLPKASYKGLDIVFGIKNIANETALSPSTVGGIPTDHTISKRSYFTGLKYRF